MDRQYVGIDFHRRRSVIVRLSADGERLGLHRIVNDPFELAEVIGLCGDAPQVVIDLFRIEDGRLAEHWDVLQDEVPVTAALAGIAMFDPDERARRP